MANAEAGQDIELSVSVVADALRTQIRVIHALILRETKTRYGQHKLGFLWAILEPIIMVALFVGIFSTMRNDNPGGMPLVPFMLAGIVPFAFFKDPMSQLQTAITHNKTLFAFPQVTTFDVILARGILEVLIICGVFGFMLFVAHLAGFEINVQRPLTVLGACGLLAMLGIGAGFLFASISPIVPSLRQLTSAFMGRPLFLSSGLFFTAESIPAEIRQWLLYNPIMHMLELLRGGFFYEFETAHGSWSYATTWAVCTLALGLLTHQAFRKRAIVGL
jgi:capsular polysaccharide transport system permease protein